MARIQFHADVRRRRAPQLLHGKMKQQRRMLVYYDFLKKPAAVLFAVRDWSEARGARGNTRVRCLHAQTDVAARGLDFPGVDWVVQVWR